MEETIKELTFKVMGEEIIITGVFYDNSKNSLFKWGYSECEKYVWDNYRGKKINNLVFSPDFNKDHKANLESMIW